MPLRDKTGLERAKAIMKYTDSESNELMIGVLHMCILPFAMFELGQPWAILQVAARARWCVSNLLCPWDGRLFMRKIAVQIASIISVATVANYTSAGMMQGSHLGWLLICAMSIWNLYRVTNESMSTEGNGPANTDYNRHRVGFCWSVAVLPITPQVEARREEGGQRSRRCSETTCESGSLCLKKN